MADTATKAASMQIVLCKEKLFLKATRINKRHKENKVALYSRSAEASVHIG